MFGGCGCRMVIKWYEEVLEEVVEEDVVEVLVRRNEGLGKEVQGVRRCTVVQQLCSARCELLCVFGFRVWGLGFRV